MNYLATHENRHRGTFDFPIELYFINEQNVRYHMPFHWHMDYEFILIHEGEFSLNVNEETYVLQKGDIAFVPDGLIHGGAPINCEYECIVFDFYRLLQSVALCRKQMDKVLENGGLPFCFFKSDTAQAAIANNLFETMKKAQKGYELITIGLIWQFMGSLLALTSKADKALTESPKRVHQMKKALQLIRKDFAQPLTLKQLSDEAGMTAKYFCRAFSKTTGKTPIDYLNYYRIECACEYLQQTENLITDIAFMCGFNDVSYFARAFKKYKGMTAKKYRVRQED